MDFLENRKTATPIVAILAWGLMYGKDPHKKPTLEKSEFEAKVKSKVEEQLYASMCSTFIAHFGFIPKKQAANALVMTTFNRLCSQ